MSLYQHILLAIDLSEGSQHIALKAQQLATSYQAKLSIIHVAALVPVMNLAYEDPALFDDNLNQLFMSTAETSLANFIESHALTPQQRFLEQGDPREEIMRVAAENQVDLIVLGSHGRHGLALLLGSTANSVLHHAKCDVLAVRLPESL